MTFQSINPFNQEIINEYEGLTTSEIDIKIEKASKGYHSWKNTSFEQRSEGLKKVAELLNTNKEKYAALITSEMGKTLSEARAEIEKCVLVCNFYAEKAEGFLSPKTTKSNNSESYVVYQPTGAIFAVMPWNFPFWQVFRFAAPTLMAGHPNG